MTKFVKFDNDLLLHVHVYDKNNVLNKIKMYGITYNNVHVHVLLEKEV